MNILDIDINTSSIDCDALVIGSGAGGSCIAATLAGAGVDVLILEEGPFIPAEKAPEKLSDSFLKLWRRGGMTLAKGSPPVAFAEGSCVGGTTEINSAIFQRAPEEIIDDWQKKFSIDNFSMKTLDPYYQLAEQTVNATPTFGELGQHSELLKKAGEKQGWKVDHLIRGHKNCVGTNHCTIGCPTKSKQSMSSSLLEQASQDGAKLIANCRVQKINTKNNKATSVQAYIKRDDAKDQQITIHAKNLFLCCGATQTPTLVQNSGLSKIIGSDFKLHPTIRLLATFKDEVAAQNSRLPLYAITEFMPDYRFGGSVYTLPTFGMFLSENWNLRQNLINSWNNSGIYYVMARGTGKGSVNSLPFGLGTNISYDLSPMDWQRLFKGMRDLAEALFAVGAVSIQPSITGLPAWTSPQEMNAALDRDIPHKNCNLMSVHMFSSAAMGENKQNNIVNSYGKMFGYDNIYIADASVIPEAPGVNPQATVMALALRTANAFLAR